LRMDLQNGEDLVHSYSTFNRHTAQHNRLHAELLLTLRYFFITVTMARCSSEIPQLDLDESQDSVRLEHLYSMRVVPAILRKR
jgi:hypothetical protein